MLLDVAMKEGKSRLISSKVNARTAIVRNNHSILDDSRGLNPIDLSKFKLMTMEMHRMRVVGPVAKDKAITCALLQDELLLVRIGLAVHQPGVELTGPT